ncbi:hypothetical protein NTG1052_440005 [Candidatus Nitrotoga sp. 1052]|nr:hypothetical protein NTG1052_440005 [Candidatus Nitrotoga sp. 1052]
MQTLQDEHFEHQDAAYRLASSLVFTFFGVNALGWSEISSIDDGIDSLQGISSLAQAGLAVLSGQLQFFGEFAQLSDATAFADWLAPLRKCEWVVYAKRPFAGPAAVLAYLSRYTHRVAISNARLVALDDEHGVTFRWKDCRAKGKTRHKTMTLITDEFMRRFLLHVLPGGFHRIRHYGLIANTGRRENLVRVRELLHVAPVVNVEPDSTGALTESVQSTFVCPDCGAAMIVIETLARAQRIRAPPELQGVP